MTGQMFFSIWICGKKYSYGETIENKQNPCEKPAISQIVKWHRTPPPPKRTVRDFSKFFFANQYLALYTSPNPPQEFTDEDCGHFIFFPPSHSIHSNTQGAELGKVFQKSLNPSHLWRTILDITTAVDNGIGRAAVHEDRSTVAQSVHGLMIRRAETHSTDETTTTGHVKTY